jgi:Fe-S cluster assembly iron-binding protein IscA
MACAAAMPIDLPPAPAPAAEEVKAVEEDEEVVVEVVVEGGGCGGRAVVVAAADAEAEGHPYDFHVSGPRNLPPPNWKEIIRSSW